MSEIFDPRENARSLRRRLNEHGVDIELLAAEAATVFDAARMHTHVRWLAFEQDGYTSAEARSFHELLGLAPDDRLVMHVKSYRVHKGHGSDGALVHHFFVEPIAKLSAAQALAAEMRSGEPLQLEFPPAHAGGKGLRVTFERDVFDRLLLGFRAALHLQLAYVAQ